MSSSSSSPPANKFQGLKDTVHKFLHQKNAFTDILGTIEGTTKVKREYMFYGTYTVQMLRPSVL